MNIDEIKNKIENIKEFGDIPRYTVEIEKNKLVVCMNNGQFTTDETMSNKDGRATFIGKFSPTDAIKKFNLN